MAPRTNRAQRLLLVGGFAVAASAAPILIAVASPARPPAPALAQCPPAEVLDPVSGTCKLTNASLNPVDPGITNLQPGGITSSNTGNVGSLPELNGIPCQGDNTGLCIGLEQQNATKPIIPNITTGATG